jgi:CRISPR-associated Cas5-like protein
MGKVWLRGEYEFASLFSYRVPNFSPAYAPSAPLPGPSTVKLALVSTRIEVAGRVDAGEYLFDGIRDTRIGLEPLSWLAVSRTFQRRLKRMKDGSIGQSFGIREYVHHGGPIGLYIEVSEDLAELVGDTMRRLRRIGTSDSLLYCIQISESEPNPTLIARPLEDFQTVLDPSLFAGRPVLPLLDIKSSTEFSQVNPYSKTSGNFTVQRMYIFPLKVEQSGEGWVRYSQHPF